MSINTADEAEKIILGFCSHRVMWACPHCNRKYLHHSSRRRHILSAHGSNMERKTIFDSDNEESNESEDEKTLEASAESDTTEEEECEEAWRKIVLEVAEQLREDDPSLSEEDQNEANYILATLLPAVMKAVEAKLKDAECIRNSETYTAVEEEKEKLMDNGMDEWEAKIMARSNRRFLIGRQISLALKKEDSGADEDEIDE